MEAPAVSPTAEGNLTPLPDSIDRHRIATSPIPARIDYWINQLTGKAPDIESAAYWFHLNGLAASARRQGLSDEFVHTDLANALAAADCESDR